MLKIGKVIYELLSKNEELKKVVDTKIYPLIANETTSFPFIIYKRTGIVNDGNKDYQSKYAMINLIVVDNEYEGSVQIAELVRKAIEHKRGKIADFMVEDITIENAIEDYVDDAFIQELTIKIEIQNEN